MLIRTLEARVGYDGWCTCAETGMMFSPTFMAAVSRLTGSRLVTPQAVKAQFFSLDNGPPLLTVSYHMTVVCRVRALAICALPSSFWWSKSWGIGLFALSLSEE